MTIYVSFPSGPAAYANKTCILSWYQIAYFVDKAVRENFSDVVYYPWMQSINFKPNDILISCVTNPEILKWKHRTIIVDNDNFDTNKWKLGRFTKYGLNKPTDYTFPYNGYLTGLYGALIKTNEVAIWKWETNHPDVIEKKNFLLANIKNFRFAPHPIDKEYFSLQYNPELKISSPRMLVYYAGDRKNAKELIDILNSQPLIKEKFDVTGEICKTVETGAILSKYTYFAHVSVSEGFPYLANEFLCQGLILYGHEEWWNGCGYEMLKFCYDPANIERNINNLKQLLSDDFIDEYRKMRKDIVQKHLSRKDNDWEYFTNILISLIKGLC